MLLFGNRGGPGAQAAVYGAIAGVMYGVSATLMNSVVESLHDDGWGVFADWQLYAMVATGLGGFVVQQVSLSFGKLATSVSSTSVVNPVISVILGAFLFQERLDTDPHWHRLVAVCGLALALVGTALITSASEKADGHGRAGARARACPVAHDQCTSPRGASVAVAVDASAHRARGHARARCGRVERRRSGTLAASWTPVSDLREQVRWLRATSDAPFCVNLVLAFEQRERLVAVLEEGARVVSLAWGVDPVLIGLARDAGAFVLVQIGERHEVTDAVRAGANAVIVQGVEAGGHVQATRSLGELVREIAPEVRVPVVAAGGIADAAGVKAARGEGAAAAACGTVFLAAEEADVHPAYVDRLIEADAAHTDPDDGL